MSRQHVLINGEWKESAGPTQKTFRAVNPRTREPLPEVYPVSPWSEIDQALAAAEAAFLEVRTWPGERFADFLDAYAAGIEQRADALVETAHTETALPKSPRLKDGELPRTTGQIRQAAQAARSGSWRRPIIDTQANIRSMFGSLGPVVVMGPNNFPFAFNSIAGGDFAAAVAAGNPVIAKGHPSHPSTTRLFAEAAHEGAQATGMPPGFVQLLYRTSHEDGAKLVADRRIGASGFTGSRTAGLALKEAADKAGKPIYLEMSSINPVCVLPGALEERPDDIAEQFVGSCLMGAGQFCTNPGLVLLIAGDATERFIQNVAQHFDNAPVGTLLAEGVLKSVSGGVVTLREAGAEIVTGGEPGGGDGFSYHNTLLRVDGATFLKSPHELQTEAFGNASLFVVAQDVEQMVEVIGHLEGNLTGCVYSDTGGADDAAYERIEPALRQRVGRLLNDKMPTGVAVTAAMNHGGPYPATGHPGFTAVGIPTAIERFAMLLCYDNVREHRLPHALRDKNPDGNLWRLIDGEWTQRDVGSSD